jgi:hypothetical protein
MLLELERRIEGLSTIALYWNPERGVCELVMDGPAGASVTDVDPEDALDALHHPHLYAVRGVTLAA